MNALSETADIVKRKWRSTHCAWKVVLLIGLIILTIMAVVGVAIWLLGRLIKSLTAGGFSNRDLYIPRIRRW